MEIESFFHHTAIHGGRSRDLTTVGHLVVQCTGFKNAFITDLLLRPAKPGTILVKKPSASEQAISTVEWKFFVIKIFRARMWKLFNSDVLPVHCPDALGKVQYHLHTISDMF